VTTLWASQTVYNPHGFPSGGWASETIVATGQGVGANMPEYWTVAGTCPRGWTETVTMAGGNINMPLEATEYTTTWWITIAAWCVPQGAWFAFFTRWEWEPPEIPLTWLLRGGTNTLAPLEPFYLEAWNEYVNAWLYENGFMLDLLILLALIMPILVRPATRRLRPT